MTEPFTLADVIDKLWLLERIAGDKFEAVDNEREQEAERADELSEKLKASQARVAELEAKLSKRGDWPGNVYD